MKKNTWASPDFSYWAVWWSALASSITRRFFVNLKYLKPWNFMMTQMDKIEWTPWEKLILGLQALLSSAGSWMIRFMLEDSFDPNNLKFTFDDKWLIPDIMGADVSDDTKQGYNSTVVDLVSQASLWEWGSYIDSLLSNNMFNNQVRKPLKKYLSWNRSLSQTEVADITSDIKLFKDYYEWKTIEVNYGDFDAVKSFFTRALTSDWSIEQWKSDKNIKLKWVSPSFWDGIGVIYDAIWEEKMNEIYNYLTSFTKTKDKKLAELNVLQSMKTFVENGWVWEEVEDLANAVISHSILSHNIHNSVPDWPQNVKVEHYLKSFTESYQWNLRNDMHMITDFVIRKHNRENEDSALAIYKDDWEWDLNPMYYSYIREERLLKQAIDKGDIDFVTSQFNPLTKSAKFTAWKSMNDDWTPNEVALMWLNRTMNYIKSTADKRTQWETAEMLWAIVQADLPNFIQLYRKWADVWIAMSEWIKQYVDNVFYTESLLTDYISDLENWYDIIKGWDWDGRKVWRLMDTFKDISIEFDKIRNNFKAWAQLSEFKQVKFPLNYNKKLDLNKMKSFETQKTSWIYSSSIVEWEPKDINRRVRLPKEFKFKQ